MKRIKSIALLVVMAFSFVFFSPTVLAENDTEEKEITTKAEILNQSAGFSLNGNKGGMTALYDEKLATKTTVESGSTIKISSTKPVSSIYILFNKVPDSWYLYYGQDRSLQGQYGFLHDFFAFPQAVTEISLSFEASTEICDIYLYGDGELPDSVEQWQPPCEKADILLLPTHADDEHLFFGGIMPYYAGELGKNVQVAYLNHHNGEWYRPHELLAGLWKVGVKNYPVIPQFNDYYSESLDHAKTLYDLEEMKEYQVELLRRFRPDVVVAHDIDGEYGHGVHMLNTYLLMQSLELSANKSAMPSSYEQYGAYNVPKTYIHLYPVNPVVLNYDIPLKSFGGKTAFEMAKEGFAQHKSQTSFFKVEQSGKYDCRKFGLYRTLVGYDTKENDLLQNLEKLNPPEVIAPVSSEPSSEPDQMVSSAETTSSEVQEEPQKTKGFLGKTESACLVIAGLLIAIFSLNRMNRKKRSSTRTHRKP